MKPAVLIMQDAIAGAVGAHDIKVRARLAPHELNTVLEHEIDGPSVHRHEERVTIPAIMNQSNLHGALPV
jgi:hypothetical protein